MNKLIVLLVSVFFSATLCAETKVIAHRGYWKTAGSAQNSLASFRKADSIGAYGSEMDVWLAKDGVLMVNHDRKFDGKYDMESTESGVLRRLELKNGETMPTLEEYLALAATKPSTRLVLELKAHNDFNRDDEAARQIVDMLRKYDMLDNTDVISFSLNGCLAFRKLVPDMPVYYLNGDLTPASVKALKLTGIDYSAKVLKKNPQWISEAHELGLPVNVWTVNNEDDMKLFIYLGADFITTDHPEQLLQLLNNAK